MSQIGNGCSEGVEENLSNSHNPKILSVLLGGNGVYCSYKFSLE